MLTIQQLQQQPQQQKQPSETLVRLTEGCVTQFGKLNISVNKALEQRRLEGFTDRGTQEIYGNLKTHR